MDSSVSSLGRKKKNLIAWIKELRNIYPTSPPTVSFVGNKIPTSFVDVKQCLSKSSKEAVTYRECAQPNGSALTFIEHEGSVVFLFILGLLLSFMPQPNAYCSCEVAVM